MPTPARCRSVAPAFLVAAALLAASCDDTQQPPANDNDVTTYGGNYDPTAGAIEFALEAPSGAPSPIVLVATDIRWAPGSGIVSAQVALRNTGNTPLPGPAGVQVRDFVPQHVQPLNADCSTTENPPPLRGPCIFDHSGTYGDDGMLGPNETSTPVLWQIEDIPGVGFSFRAQLVQDAPARGGLISGVVFDDLDRNGVRNPGEPGIAGMVVNLRVPNGPDPVELIQRTDVEGRYAFRVRSPGVYPLRKLPARGWVATTASEIQVLVMEAWPGQLSDFTQGDFGCASPQGAGVLGSVYVDANRNGVREYGEPGIAGVEILAWGLECDFPEFGAAVTDADGRYALEASAIRCSTPWVVQRGGVEGMSGTGPSQWLGTGVPADDARYLFDFGLAPVEIDPIRVVLSVLGTVYVDTNGDGSRDTSEPGVRNVPMTLLSPCEIFTRPVFTDPRGEYRFEPHETGFCPIMGVHRGNPDLTGTTKNPVPIDPILLPGFHEIVADFGVLPRPESNAP